jgi:hypothetical protein
MDCWDLLQEGSPQRCREARIQKVKRRGMRKCLINVIRERERARAEGPRTIAIKFSMQLCDIQYRFQSRPSPNLNLSLDLIALSAFLQDPDTGARA